MVGDRLDEKPGTLVLGVRRFLGPVPLRSRIGNTLTRWLFRLLLGVSLTDTQTGLRERLAPPQCCAISCPWRVSASSRTG